MAKLPYSLAQGQQVECQECERLARQVKHWQDLAVANRKVADKALFELSALKAQQVGPVELRLCEQNHLVLQPGRLYLFTVDQDCPNCVALANGLVVLSEDAHTHALAVLEAAHDQGEVRACKWQRDEDTGAYETACGSTWCLADGGAPDEHGQYYCHHCGKPIDDGKE